MADILPECLIQKILCYLSFKKAAKKSILSKTWLQACLTLPNLEFTVDLESNMKIVDNIMERYRDGNIPIVKFELSYSVDSLDVFPLIDKWLDTAFQNDVKDLVLGDYGFTSYILPIFTILAAKSLKELVLRKCNLKGVSLSSGVPNCHSLRKLSLSFVRLDEIMLQTLINSSPLIVVLILEYCYGLKKIKSVYLKVLKIEDCGGIGKIDAPNLVSLEYMGHQIPELKSARESSQLKHKNRSSLQQFKCCIVL